MMDRHLTLRPPVFVGAFNAAPGQRHLFYRDQTHCGIHDRPTSWDATPDQSLSAVTCEDCRNIIGGDRE